MPTLIVAQYNYYFNILFTMLTECVSGVAMCSGSTGVEEITDLSFLGILEASIKTTPTLIKQLSHSSISSCNMLSIFLCFFFYSKPFSLICYYLIASILTVTSSRVIEGHVYVYQGNPYNYGPLATEHLILTETLDSSPEHMSGIIHNIVDICQI